MIIMSRPLLQLIQYVDLTNLNEGSTNTDIKQLCEQAKHPTDIKDISVASVCVTLDKVVLAKQLLHNTDVKVCVGFIDTTQSENLKLHNIRKAVKFKADEIDIVLDEKAVHNKDYTKLYNDILKYRFAAKDKCLKIILSASNIRNLSIIRDISNLCLKAGADFIKTSTGREDLKVTELESIVMIRCVEDYFLRTGNLVGFKISGGIDTVEQSLIYLRLVKALSSYRDIDNNKFRIGTSKLLADLTNKLHRLI